MPELRERVEYVRGLAEGSFGDRDGAGRFVRALVALVEAIAERLEDLDDLQMDLVDDVDELRDRLERPAPRGYVQVRCVRCGELVFFERDLLADRGVELTCPSCGEPVYEERATPPGEEQAEGRALAH